MKNYLWIISFVMYVLSLLLPVYGTANEPPEVGQGMSMLAMGWIVAITEGGMALAWFANPLFISALCTSKKFPVASTYFAGAAVLLGLCFLKGGKIYSISDMAEAGYISKIGIGYWSWLGSMVILLVTSIWRIKERRELK